MGKHYTGCYIGLHTSQIRPYMRPHEVWWPHLKSKLGCHYQAGLSHRYVKHCQQQDNLDAKILWNYFTIGSFIIRNVDVLVGYFNENSGQKVSDSKVACGGCSKDFHMDAYYPVAYWGWGHNGLGSGKSIVHSGDMCKWAFRGKFVFSSRLISRSWLTFS